MKLPEKSGVAAEGKYYGRVDCSSQIEEGDGKYHWKDKWVGGQWKYNGDRRKPHLAERKGRYLKREAWE